MFTSLYLVAVIKKISKFNFIIHEALQCKLRGFFVIEINYNLLFLPQRTSEAECSSAILNAVKDLKTLK